MKRKAKIIVLTMLTLLLFTSCATKQTMRKIKPEITEITCPQEDGFHLFSVGMLDDNLLIAVLAGDIDIGQKKIYKMNLLEGTKKLIYEVDTEESYFSVRLKTHSNETYSIQFENNVALIFNNSNDQLIQTVNFDKVSGYSYNISYDGKKVAYVTKYGLCMSDLDMMNEAVIYNGEMSPYWSVLSGDDSKIAFLAKSRDRVTKMCAICNLETKETASFNCSATDLYWLSGSDGLIACDDGSMLQGDTGESKIWYLNLDGSEQNTLDVKSYIRPKGVISAGMLYNYDPRPLTEDGGYRDYKMMLWNYKSGELRELDLGYRFVSSGSCSVLKYSNKFLLNTSVLIGRETTNKVLLVDLG